MSLGIFTIFKPTIGFDRKLGLHDDYVRIKSEKPHLDYKVLNSISGEVGE
jgi:hypothetical protein